MGDPGVTTNGHSNGHSNLPDKDSSDIYLVVATHEENIAQTTANSSEWKGALPTLDAYHRREAHLANLELTKDGGLTPWMLVYQPDGAAKRQVLCGCESIRKKALVGRNGKVEEVIAHGVCSVFCPPAKRGRGYAGRMMSELGKKLRRWQLDNGKDALFSVLFSDIGKDFYAARGWKPFPSAHVALPAVETVADELPPVRMLCSKDLLELCEVDESAIRRRLAKLKDTESTAVALVPDNRTLRWHHAREEFVGKELLDKAPEIKGAIVGEPSSRVFCYWARVWTNPQEDAPNTLHILRLVIEDESFANFSPASPEAAAKMKGSSTAKAIAALFTAAQSEAAKWGMKEVLIWNPTSTTLAAAQLLDASVEVQHREKESIASLLWYGEGSGENVDWICNEKYEWC